MNEQEMRDFLAARKPSNGKFMSEFDVTALHCYGCAHAASSEPPPGKPSGERPCCSCIRNTERETWIRENVIKFETDPEPLLIDDQGNARCFNPFGGFAYNGAPYVNFPMDNYVTMDQRDQERFYEKHPEYALPVRTHGDGTVTVVVDDND